MGSFLRKLSSDWKIQYSQRSTCDHCHKMLSWYELIPLISRVMQWGKCRNCKKHLSSDYITSELLSGIVFMCIWYVVRIFPFLIQLWIGIITSLLLFCCFYDIKKKELSTIAFILLFMSIIGLYFSFFSRNTWSAYSMRTSLQYIPYEQYYWLLNEIWISVSTWWWIWFLIWLLWAWIYYYKQKELGQWLGFGDVLFACILWSLLPFFMIVMSIFFGGAEWLHIENYSIRSIGLIIYHVLFSSVLWIIWFCFFKENEFAFLPYMMWWFLFLAIAIFIFPNYFITLLWG
jgi:prepilin signal peptidase PulO-like enzyme (type II secretory pathway)